MFSCRQLGATSEAHRVSAVGWLQRYEQAERLECGSRSARQTQQDHRCDVWLSQAELRLVDEVGAPPHHATVSEHHYTRRWGAWLHTRDIIKFQWQRAPQAPSSTRRLLLATEDEPVP